MASSIIDEEGGDYLFEYSTSVEDAVAPEPLPEREYIGEVTDARKQLSNISGKDQLVLTILIGVDQFPADYNPENNPDGARLIFYSRDVDDSIGGKYAMQQLCKKMKVPMGPRFKSADFVGKRVKVDVGHRQGQDEVTYNKILGLPEAVD